MPSSSPSSLHQPASESHAFFQIADVENETGIGKDTLRVWERRYQFPIPNRDRTGHRLYSLEQVKQLKLISRLLELGLRPSKVVGLTTADLQSLLEQHSISQTPDLSKTNKAILAYTPLVESLLKTIAQHDSRALHHALIQAQMRLGLTQFITALVAPLTTAVGEAWAQGRFEVFEEHLYTEVITSVLRQVLGTLPAAPNPQPPKVLLTTVPQEPHGLGLLMVEAILSLEGCTCVSLGTQTPLSDIVHAATAHRADIVALSFSSLLTTNAVQANLRPLRAQLPPSTALWVGGSCSALYDHTQTGIHAIHNLTALPLLIQQWRATDSNRQ